MTTVLAPSDSAVRDVRLIEPMPGFDDERHFTLGDIDPDGVLLALRSARDPLLRFVLTPSEVFFTDYDPEFPDIVAAELGVSDAAELRLLLVLTIGAGLAEATANLRAPIVYAPVTGRALQVVLDDDSLPMRQPILGAAD